MWAPNAEHRSGLASGGAPATDPLFTSPRRNREQRNRNHPGKSCLQHHPSVIVILRVIGGCLVAIRVGAMGVYTSIVVLR
jgi:hypothetical protein